MNILTTSTTATATADSSTWAASIRAAVTKKQGSLSVGGTATSSSDGSGGSDGSGDTGDTVTISDEAKSLAAKATETEPESTAEATVKKIQKMIKEIQQQIKDAEKDPRLTKDARTAKIQLLQSQLMLLETELAKQQSGSSILGGTPAQGMANSLT